MRTDTEAPLLILRRNLGALQHGALGVARSAGRLGIPVYSVRLSAHEPSTSSRYIRGSLPLPATSSSEEWVNALMGLARELDGGILLPIDDRAAVTVGDYQDTLGERFRLARQPAKLQRRLASKRELHDLCHGLGLPTAVSLFPTSVDEAAQQATRLGYPVVLKRAEPWRPSRDPRAPNVLIAAEHDDLVRGYARMDSAEAPQVMIQEYIPGGSDSIWMFNGYFDRNSNCLCAFVGRKLRQRPPRTGPTTLGVCVSNERVAAAAKRMMRELGYHGIVDMGFRYDPRDDQYKLLDVNPRLGSTFRLFAAKNGIDVVRALHLDLTGLTVPSSTTTDGRKWLDEPSDLFTFGELARRGELSVRAWGRSLRGVDETAWWARDDPWPFVAMGVRIPVHAVRGLARRGRQRAVHTGRMDERPPLTADAR